MITIYIAINPYFQIILLDDRSINRFPSKPFNHLSTHIDVDLTSIMIAGLIATIDPWLQEVFEGLRRLKRTRLPI